MNSKEALQEYQKGLDVIFERHSCILPEDGLDANQKQLTLNRFFQDLDDNSHALSERLSLYITETGERAIYFNQAIDLYTQTNERFKILIRDYPTPNSSENDSNAFF